MQNSTMELRQPEILPQPTLVQFFTSVVISAPTGLRKRPQPPPHPHVHTLIPRLNQRLLTSAVMSTQKTFLLRSVFIRCCLASSSSCAEYRCWGRGAAGPDWASPGGGGSPSDDWRSFRVPLQAEPTTHHLPRSSAVERGEREGERESVRTGQAHHPPLAALLRWREGRERGERMRTGRAHHPPLAALLRWREGGGERGRESVRTGRAAHPPLASTVRGWGCVGQNAGWQYQWVGSSIEEIRGK